MKLVSYRGGRATNSSSSHSVVITGKRAKNIPPWTDYHYGWEDFQLSDYDAKATYLSVMLRDDLQRFGDEMPEGVSYCDVEKGGIDHNTNRLDMTYKNTTPKEVIEAMANCDDLIIYGGNDNNDYCLWALDTNNGMVEILNSYTARITATKVGDEIILFNSRTGNMLRLSPSGEQKKLMAPVLVDMSITDYCTQGCAFCYRGSDAEGYPAPTSDVTDMLDQMAKMGVLEIAIGGGDPLSHPGIKDILSHAIDLGIMPNVTIYGTVKNLRRLKKIVEDLGYGAKESIGAGVSVHTLTQHNHISKNWGDQPDNMVYHIVEGVTPAGTVKKIIDGSSYSSSHVLLLGYKELGRASGTPKGWTDEEVIDILRTANNPPNDFVYPVISVDTLFAKRHQKALDELGVSKVLYSTAEGETSFFIDMVHHTYAPASYLDDKYSAEFGERPNFIEMWNNCPVVK